MYDFPWKIEVESRNNLANAYFLLQEPNNDAYIKIPIL